MSRVCRLAAAVLLVVAVLPEAWRLAGNRALYRVTSALRMVAAGTAPDRTAALAWAEQEAARAAGRLPGNPGPPAAAGAARLLARDADGALAWYARSLRQGERPETDLNIGRALMIKRDLAGAQVAFLRAGWLAPHLLEELPAVARHPLSDELDRLASLLVAGELRAAPPPPAPLAAGPPPSSDR